MLYVKSNRGVNGVHRTLFKSPTRTNIGPSKAHHMMKEQVGLFETLGVTNKI